VGREEDVTIALREITSSSADLASDPRKENPRDILKRKVAPEQEGFVAPNAVSIAQAYFDRVVAWFRAIYADDTPVGFAMLHDEPAERKYFLWRFMVDHRFQGHGYGAEALSQVIAYVRQRPGAREFLTCVGRGKGSLGAFTRSWASPAPVLSLKANVLCAGSSEALRLHWIRIVRISEQLKINYACQSL
jgi:diamine N-acetyltransferase